MMVFDVKHALTFSHLEQWTLADTGTKRLLLACVLGGAIGLDREFHHKPSGIRTNLLICFGAALFTYLSPLIAGEMSTSKGQIASNIVQGVGFLGAGLILHNRNRVSGLTSAATVFAVASIGMACGAGLYVPAAIAALLVLLTLEAVGALELFSNLKLLINVYEVRGADADRLERSVLDAMDTEGHRLDSVDRETLAGLSRLTFTVMASRRGHRRLKALIARGVGVERVLSFRTWEEE